MSSRKPWSVCVYTSWLATNSGLLLRNAISTTAIQKPYYLLYIHIMVIQIKLLNSTSSFFSCSSIGSLEDGLDIPQVQVVIRPSTHVPDQIRETRFRELRQAETLSERSRRRWGKHLS